MTHVDDGVLMAYVDDELSPPARAATAAHVLACPECRRRLDELAAADRLLEDALAFADGPAPVARAHSRFRAETGAHRMEHRGAFARTFIRVAGLVLLLAAGASAAVPGSPVRNWIRSTLVPKEKPAASTSPANAMSGVSILPVNGRVDIAVSNAAPGTRLRVRAVDGPRATVTVPGTRKVPEFHTSPGRIDVVGAVDSVLIDVPKAATEVHVTVNGEPYVVGGNGKLRAVVTAETRDGELMFTLR
ncbi:MAG: zf-HC2 domain-containing protein [Gemmatimonadota bacterium]